MECDKCKKLHLSEEFPTTISEECHHPVLFCYTCVLQHLQAQFSHESQPEVAKCIEPTCNSQVTKQNFQELKQSSPYDFLEIIKNKTTRLIVPPTGELPGGMIRIVIKTIDSRFKEITISPQTQVLELKKKIQALPEFNVVPDKQRLNFQKQVLENRRRLEEYGIQDQSEINLLILMIEIKPDSTLLLNQIQFQLSWGFPGQVDYMDASVHLFLAGELVDYVDFEKRTHSSGDKIVIRHSGDHLDPKRKRGSHRIDVTLGPLTSADMLFFTLSSYNSPTLKEFIRPTVSLVETSNPTKILSTYTFQGAQDLDQALIMCVVSKKGDGSWSIAQLGRHSKGNNKKYEPLQKSVLQLIKDANFLNQ